MAKSPAFPFYASDWLGSNRRAMMTLEQQAAYINLLARQWSDPTCSLPDDDEALSRLSELGQGWFNGGCHLLRECFPSHPTLVGRIANEKLLKLRSERDDWVQKSRKGGQLSAANRAKRKALDAGKGGSQMVASKVPTKRQPKVNSPSPFPSPSPTSESSPAAQGPQSASPTLGESASSPSKETEGGAGGNQKSPTRAEQIQAVVTHYRTYHPQAAPSLKKDCKVWKLLECRLIEGYTVEQLCRAIDGCHLSPFHQGANDRNMKYLSLELIFRDYDHTARFIEYAEHPPQLMTEKEARGRMAGQQWLRDMEALDAATRPTDV